MKHLHFLGIGGIGMSGLAKLALEQGYKVSGSDRERSPLTASLEALGAQIFEGHSPSQLEGKEALIYSSGIPPTNPVLIEAAKRSIPRLHRSELLAIFAKKKRSFAIAGTHGKTTTTAIATDVFASHSPSLYVGGILQKEKTNAKWTNEPLFFFEADESDASHICYEPEGTLLLNLELDHHTTYNSIEALQKTFLQLYEQTKDKSLFFYNGQDPHLQGLFPEGTPFGSSGEFPLFFHSVRREGFGLRASVVYHETVLEDLFFNTPLEHNLSNALPVLALALRLGLSEQEIKEALASFKGVQRRLDLIHQENELFVFDDYAHHPTEIHSTLTSLRNTWKEHKLVAIFEPHRPSRLQACLSDFAKAFQHIDHLILTDTYTAGEQETLPFSPKELLEKIEAPKKDYIPLAHLKENLETTLRPFDVAISLGAGSLHKLMPTLNLSQAKLRVGIFYGGESVEHTISCRSFKEVEKHLCSDTITTVPIYIDQEGSWKSSSFLDLIDSLDIAFPLIHGPKGEDGTLQGLFEFLGLPYVGSPWSACAVAMNKDLCKKVLLSQGLPVVPYQLIKEKQTLQKPLTYPLFVKPTHLGSSVGISHIFSEEALDRAIDLALSYDSSCLLEPEIQGRELEFIVLGNEQVTVYPPGEILKGDTFYSYERKYGKKAVPTTLFPKLDPLVKKEGMELAKQAYLAIGCQGYARVDFFLDQENRWWINEINPTPGFTKTSLLPQITKEYGLPMRSLILQLLQMGLQRARKTCKSVYP